MIQFSKKLSAREQSWQKVTGKLKFKKHWILHYHAPKCVNHVSKLSQQFIRMDEDYLITIIFGERNRIFEPRLS